MAKAILTIDELIYNEILVGKQIYYNNTIKIISGIKLVKHTRQMQISCTDGDVFLANQDDTFEFETDAPKSFVSPNKPKLMKKT